MQGKVDKFTVIVNNFYIPNSTIEKTKRKKICKGIEYLNKIANQFNKIESYRMHHPPPKKTTTITTTLFLTEHVPSWDTQQILVI